MKGKLALIGGCSFGIGLLFNWLFYGKAPGISVLLFVTLIFGVFFGLNYHFRIKLRSNVYGLMFVTLLFAVMVCLRASAFLLVINTVVILYLLLLIITMAYKSNPNLRQYKFVHYVNVISNTPAAMLEQLSNYWQMVSSYRNTEITKSSRPIVRGLAISVPILLTFVLLLSSADLVFKSFVSTLFKPHISLGTLLELSVLVWVVSIAIGVYGLLFLPRTSTDRGIEPQAAKPLLNATEAAIILGSVCALFLVFVAIQFTYLFAGSNAITTAGYTYAEYARKGFFELIIVAAISLLLVLCIKKLTSFRNHFQRLLFKWLSSVLTVEVLIIMVSAHLRLNLYQAAYGFTTLRLLSHLFIAWLAVAFILLLINVIRETSENVFALQLFVSGLVFIMLINIINPDAFIAHQNISRFQKTGKIDAVYLSSLSADATPVLVQAQRNSNTKLQSRIKDILKMQSSALPQTKHWQSSNLAKERAQQLFSLGN